jgi:hypothetical protein
MLNMALHFGKDNYWTKIILAINLTYLSRIIYYNEKKFGKGESKSEEFGLLNMTFYVRSLYKKRFYDDCEAVFDIPECLRRTK